MADDWLEPLDALGILGRSITVLRYRPVVCLPNVVPLVIVYVIFWGLLYNDYNDELTGSTLILAVVVGFCSVSFFSEAVVARWVAEVYTAGESSSALRPNLSGRQWLALWISSMVTLLFLVGPPMLLAHWNVPGIFILLWIGTGGLSVLALTWNATPSIVLEPPMKDDYFDKTFGLFRAVQLSAGYRGLILGSVLLYGTVVVAVLVLCLGIAMVLDTLLPQLWLSVALGLAVPVPMVAIGSILKTVVYLDNRVKKEKLTREQLIRELSGVASTNNTTTSSSDDDNHYASMGGGNSNAARSEKPPARTPDTRQVLV